MTKMVRIPIALATDEQLLDFCLVQQLEPSNLTRSGLMAALQPVWEHDYILAQEEGTTSGQDRPATPTPQQEISSLGGTDPIWLIEIGETEMPGGKDPVPVSVNGRCVVLQRNMTISLPHRFKLALDLAVRETVDQDERTHEITTSKVRNYPFQILERPSAEEVRAWEERTGGIELGRDAQVPLAA